MFSEFEIIKQFFMAKQSQRKDIQLGIGDDAALLRLPADHELVVTTDTLVANIHFRDTDLPADIGYKALAVNLSDLAAMGAEPLWFSLALTLPQSDLNWLHAFSEGLFDCANAFSIALIGGDTTSGSLSITITAHGKVPNNTALKRSGAQVGDGIYVTGELGAAGFAFRYLNKPALTLQEKQLTTQLHRPYPRIHEGLHLRQLATAAIDISDGLAADLGHILKSSHVGATIDFDQLPLPHVVTALPDKACRELALMTGDDYELCFTTPEKYHSQLSNLPCQRIGCIDLKKGLRISHNGLTEPISLIGYQHF